MTGPLFDDHLSSSDETDHDTKASDPPLKIPPQSRPLKRFDTDGLLGDLPKDDDPLYPDLAEPPVEPATPKRPLPWCIDIFLYPFNRAGTLTLGIILTVPTILVLMILGSIKFAGATLLLIFVVVPLAFVAFLMLVLMMLYYIWYLAECIRDSSEGAIRAPDTIGQSPGLFELFGHFIQITISSAIFVGLFLSVADGFSLSPIARQVWGAGLGLTVPITFLGVVTLESLRGLNPVTNLRLICKTGITYLPTSAALYAAHWWLFRACCHFLPHDGRLPLSHVVFVLVEFYGLLITAHVLGRFAWRQRDRLFWE